MFRRRAGRMYIIIWRMFDERDLRGIAKYKKKVYIYMDINIYRYFANALVEEETVSSRLRIRLPAYVNEIPILLLLFFFILQRIKQTGREIRPYRGPQYIDEHWLHDFSQTSNGQAAEAAGLYTPHERHHSV
jgi:hypothetical protein